MTRIRPLLLALLLSLAALTLRSQAKPSISILGDSYSTFEGFVKPDTNLIWYHAIPEKDRTDVENVRQTWWHHLISDNGYKLEVNNSYSGSTICNRGYRNEDYSDRSFITRMTNLGSPDIILVFGGTNDSWAGSPIGEYKYSDWTDEDLYSVCPALAKLLSGLGDLYPGSRVVFILNSELKDEIDSSVIEVCNHYGVDCVILDNIEKMSGHPSRKGMEEIARQVAPHLR